MTHTDSERPAGWLSSFLRQFVVQGSWNNRSMLGSGFAFCMIPLLRGRGLSGEGLDDAVRNHTSTFNTHPYLAGLVLGAVTRMEDGGADPETIARFKRAIQGALGALGDVLVWGAWRPVTILLALVLVWAGAPPWIPVSVFLVLYNGGHLALRWWGYNQGLAYGGDVGKRLHRAELSRLAERAFSAGALLLGILAGALVVSRLGAADAGWLWSFAGVSAFGVGLKFGHRALRGATLFLVLVITFLTALGRV
jgi:PTS system mannose-specific IID component